MKISSVLLLGLAGGLAFTAHALVNGSQAWPLVWPAVTGTAAVMLHRRDSMAGALRTGAVSGSVAGIVFLAASYAALTMMDLAARVSVGGLLLAAVLGVVAATVSGGIAAAITSGRRAAG